jgi:5-methyltetrahydropteroyltriglutamate--homocysteine methyltransferase
MAELPLFPTALIGSLPRTKEILGAHRGLRSGKIKRREFDALIFRETEKMIRLQEDAGIDIITSGELGRDNYVSFVADKLGGVLMKSMSELLEYVDDKKAFEDILVALDVPAVSIRNAICVDRLRYEGDIAAGELAVMKRLTANPVKITLPGPYLLTRSMWLPKLSGTAYRDKEELGEDVIRVLKAEIGTLQEIGVDVIQFDEPVLTEVVFTEGRPRTFMCAALSEKKDPAEELAFAAHLIKSVMHSVDRSRSVASLHVCRGNWSRDESILLSGPYTPLLDVFAETKPDLLALEFSTPRAGEMASLLEDTRISRETALGLGVVNPRTDTVEEPELIAAGARTALRWIPKNRLWLNPDCGFATFGNRPVNTVDVACRKMRALAEASEILRRQYGSGE